MKLRDCYAKLDGDFENVLSRLMRESSISRFLIMLLNDDQLDLLQRSLAASDFETAFRAAHTLKGTAMNLGVTKLAQDASTVTELLRNGAPNRDISAEVNELETEYVRTKKIIGEYAAEPEF